MVVLSITAFSITRPLTKAEDENDDEDEDDLGKGGLPSCVLFLNGRKYFLEILSRVSLEMAH